MEFHTFKGCSNLTLNVVAGSYGEQYVREMESIPYKVISEPTPVPKVTLSGVKAGSRSFTAEWKKSAVATDCQLQYGLKKSFSGAKTVKVKKAGTVSATVKSLQSGKTYYVRVRFYKTVNKKNYYSAWSGVKTVKVK